MKIQVWVGGCLPESAIPELVETLQDDQIQLIDGWAAEQETIDHLIKNFKAPNSIELGFDIDIDGSTSAPDTDLNLDDYCKAHNLHIKKLLPPGRTSDGENFNECLFHWAPGMDFPDSIMTNGEGATAIDQAATLTLHEKLWRLYSKDKPLDDCPLHVNDKDGDVSLFAKARLAGKDFGEIFKEILLKRVGHEEIDMPPFTIQKGK